MEVSPVEEADCTVLTAMFPPPEELLVISKNAEVTGVGEIMGENPLTDWDPSESW